MIDIKESLLHFITILETFFIAKIENLLIILNFTEQFNR